MFTINKFSPCLNISLKQILDTGQRLNTLTEITIQQKNLFFQGCLHNQKMLWFSFMKKAHVEAIGIFYIHQQVASTNVEYT